MGGPFDPGPDEDPEHPIPRLDTFDVLITTNLGATVGIVIASPLRDDAMSRARLTRKFEVSVGYFVSDEFRRKHHDISREHSWVTVRVHAESDPLMLRLVEDYCSQVRANGISSEFKLVGTN